LKLLNMKPGNTLINKLLASAPSIVLGLALMASLPMKASACSCVPPESAIQAIETTPYIAWVRVVNKSIKGKDRVFQAEAWTAKGAVKISIYSPKDGGLCGVDLALNQPVLLGMRKFKGRFQTDSCTSFTINYYHDEVSRLIGQCKPFEPCP